MKKFLILLLFAPFIFSQTKLDVDLDYSRFNYDDSTGYLELYYGFLKSQLKTTKIDNKEIVKGTIQIKIREKKNDNVVLDKSWQINDAVDSSSIVNNQMLNGVINLRLTFNSYSFLVTSYDANDNSVLDTASFDLEIQPLPNDRFSISDIQLASSITSTNERAEAYFVKNNHEVIPNPSGIYGENLPVLYFYSELYNLDKNTSSDFLKINYLLLNSYDRKMVSKSKFVSTKNKSIIDVGALNILKCPTGAYTLKVEIVDSINSMAVTASKKLYIYNPAVVDTEEYFNYKPGLARSEFSLMSDEEIIQYFEYSRYIATQVEIDSWKKLNTEAGRKEYLINFWNNKNKNSGLEENNYQKEYFRRVEAANKRFNTLQKVGWKSDRGRIFIMYGEPSEIETYPDAPDMKPYEVWKYYEIESGVTFIFGNIEGFGDYSLINSTKKGELKDENWQRFIQTK